MGAESTDSQSSRSLPSSMRHKRILDIAAAQPDASVEAIAAEVPSATADLVEHVLEKHGDPAADVADEAVDGADEETVGSDEPADADDERTPAADAGPDDESVLPDPSELTDKQRATLRVVHDDPDLTQRELADRFGVTSSTICNRVNAIDGFDWENRREITATIFGATDAESADADAETTDAATMAANETDSGAQQYDLRERLTALERQLEELETVTEPALQDPKLVHKVMHACLKAETITEEEELQLLQTFLR